MLLNRPDMIYRNGMLATQHRERVSNVPLRYKHTWTVRKVVELSESQIEQYERHCVILDDAGLRVIYTCTETLGEDLNKRQANALLGQ